MKKALLRLVVLLLVVGGAVLFIGRRSVAPVPSKAVAPTTEPVDSVPVDTSIVSTTPTTREIVIEGSNFKFVPAQFSVKKGERVRLFFKNTGGVHDFKIDELGVATKKIGSGGSDTVEFTAEKTGTFEYYCSIGEHRQMGMRGRLIVTE